MPKKMPKGQRKRGPSALKALPPEASSRSPRKSNKGQQGITVEKYEELWAAYQVDQTAAYLVKTCVISQPTALKYINSGDPGRNLTPLRERFKALQAKTQEVADYNLAKAQAKTLDLTRRMKLVLDERLKGFEKDPKKHRERWTEALAYLHKIEAAALGGVTDSLMVRGMLEDAWSSATDEEVIEALEATSAALRRYGYGAAKAWEAPGGLLTDPARVSSHDPAASPEELQ